MSFINKVKNTFTKGKFKDEVEYTSNDQNAIDELVNNLGKFNECLVYSLESIGAFPTNYGETNIGKAEFYQECYIRRGAKEWQIDELFKYYVINGVTNKGGIFGGFRNWSNHIYSQLKSIVSKSRSQIEKIEKIRDSNRKEHWQKFYDIGIDAYDKLQKVFDPEIFNKKFVENGNKNSRLATTKVKDAIAKIAEKMKTFSSEFHNSRNALDKFTLDKKYISPSINDKFKGNDDKTIWLLVDGINQFINSMNNLYISGVKAYKSGDNNYYVKRGLKSYRMEENFKKFVIEGVIDRGNKFGGFRKWSDGIYSQLKSITSKAHSKIAKIEKITDCREHWKQFYGVELEALNQMKKVFDPNDTSNEKYLSNKKSRLSNTNVTQALQNLEKAIDKKIELIEGYQQKLEKTTSQASN